MCFNCCPAAYFPSIKDAMSKTLFTIPCPCHHLKKKNKKENVAFNHIKEPIVSYVFYNL